MGQIVQPERLVDQFGDSSRTRFFFGQTRPRAGTEDDGKIRSQLPTSMGQSISRYIGQSQIGNQEIEAMRSKMDRTTG
jgi:hypothetical protein